MVTSSATRADASTIAVGWMRVMPRVARGGGSCVDAQHDLASVGELAVHARAHVEAAVGLHGRLEHQLIAGGDLPLEADVVERAGSRSASAGRSLRQGATTAARAPRARARPASRGSPESGPGSRARSPSRTCGRAPIGRLRTRPRGRRAGPDTGAEASAAAPRTRRASRRVPFPGSERPQRALEVGNTRCERPDPAYLDGRASPLILRHEGKDAHVHTCGVRALPITVVAPPMTAPSAIVRWPAMLAAPPMRTLRPIGRAARDARASRDRRMRTDAAVVADLDLVVELDVVLDRPCRRWRRDRWSCSRRSRSRRRSPRGRSAES